MILKLSHVFLLPLMQDSHTLLAACTHAYMVTRSHATRVPADELHVIFIGSPRRGGAGKHYSTFKFAGLCSMDFLDDGGLDPYHILGLEQGVSSTENDIKKVVFLE